MRRFALLACLAVALLHAFVVQVSVVRGHSMEPSLCDGDRLVVDRVSPTLAGVARFDVVILGNPRDPSVDYVKRVAALPGDVVALHDGEAAHAEPLGDVVLAGDLDALAARVELEPVIHAADIVAFHSPVGKLGPAVAAAVVERHHPSAVAFVEKDRGFQDGARQELAVDELVVPGRDVPGVRKEGSGGSAHGSVPGRGLSASA